MDMAFRSREYPCLYAAVNEVQNVEQTQELRLSDDLPDIGKIIGFWGQVVLRGKEWRGDCILVTGGMNVWVLYAPEDGTQMRTVDSWIPFQLKWQLPEGTPEGQICVVPLLRFVDARSISPRKMMIRVGIGALGQGLVPQMLSLTEAESASPDVELLRMRYPVRLLREAGEKSFQMEEDFTLPISQPNDIVYRSLNPEITDQKVIGNKIAFRGNGNLHLLYKKEDGSLSVQDYLMPFSQFAELPESYSADAQADVFPAVTDLELESDEDGNFVMKAGILAQYAVDDVSVLETIEDAYSPGNEAVIEQSMLHVPAILEKRTDVLTGEQTASGSGVQVLDASFLPDFPRQYRENGGVSVEMPGSAQILYYGQDGALRSQTSRWEGKAEWKGDDSVEFRVIPSHSCSPQVSFGMDTISIRTEVPVSVTATGGQGIPVVTGLSLKEGQERDAARPSLIIRKAGTDTLWNIAKASGSSMDAIRKANDFQDEPIPGQMLLIPVL